MQRIFKRIYTKNFGKPSSPDNWICRKCGTENSKLLTECSNCSSINKASAIKPSEDTWLCNNCDYKNPVSDKSCARCGMRKEGKNGEELIPFNWIAFLILGILLIVFGGGIIAFILLFIAFLLALMDEF